ncbi:MAG: pyroglutamyl-peptidase I [Sandaracinaceae bacterium]|nr:pyroglutamyl-peptidase I [Sandaracinaceae bacterium]
MRVLVTGFGPFLDNAVNPSDALARELDGRRVEGVRLVACSPLPVVHGRAADRALEAARRHGADAIVAFGLAAGTKRPRVEGVGRNRGAGRHADNAGRIAGGPVVPGAPATRRATLPAAPVRQALFAAGIYSFASDDAGGYVCNDLFYRLLHAGAPTLFVHIPEHLDVRRAASPFARGIARAARAWARA